LLKATTRGRCDRSCAGTTPAVATVSPRSWAHRRPGSIPASLSAAHNEE
jgi:hypothetical protein